jgi:hypothetical protein
MVKFLTKWSFVVGCILGAMTVFDLSAPPGRFWPYIAVALLMLPSVFLANGKRRIFAGIVVLLAIAGSLQQHFAGQSLNTRLKAARDAAATNETKTVTQP